MGVVMNQLWILVTVCAALAASASAVEEPADCVRVLLVHLHPVVDLSEWSLSADTTDDAAKDRANRRERTRSLLGRRVRDGQAAVSQFIQTGLDGISDGASIPLVRITPLWIQNALIVRLDECHNEANGQAARRRRFLEEELRWFPGVVQVEADEPVVRLIEAERDGDMEDGDEAGMDSAPQKNIQLLHAPELWSRGIQGEGVVVASLDSGVRYTHEALKDSFRGTLPNGSVDFDYSFWFVPGTDISKETPETADLVGHGTHTVGTAVGGKGIGVAPKSTWIAARAFNEFGAANKSDFLLAAQWVICPTRVDGSGENCTKGADVVINSFGVDRSTPEYPEWKWMNKVVHVWRAAGTYPVFASGNTNGFLCGSVYYPASRVETIAVGALIGGRTLWGASGKGPSTDSDMLNDSGAALIVKPDFVAPGAAIRSALSTKDAAYTRMTGTSMATPHIAGAIALLLSLNATTHIQESKVIEALQGTTTRDLSKPFLVPSSCGNTTYQQYPNNIYGWGLANVCLAASKLGTACNEIESIFEATTSLTSFVATE